VRKGLTESECFSQFFTTKKHFMDTTKLIAHRPETVLMALTGEKLSRPDDARTLVQQVFESAVDFCPDT
jgi:hypothetical protein